MQKAEIARVYGIVQGVGFRPSVDRLAHSHGIKGSVSNKGPYVEIDAQGEADDIDAFFDDLLHNPPERAIILKLDREDAPANTGKDNDFRIIESEKVLGEIFVSPDIATCKKCREELFDPTNRRYLHPFINCTSCGPRATILDGMPYDRVRTSMADFPMCPECEYEYTHSETRRYDAQPVCCNDCGPEVYLLTPGAADELPVDVKKLPEDRKGRAAITEVRRVVSGGGIAAIKGIGGFHLCCDATNEAAVQRLRDLKPRPAKPFAVMMRDLDAVRRECVIEEYQEEIIDGHQKPIMLLRKSGREDAKLAPGIAPDNPAVGVMLPYAPVQMLLFDYPDGISMPDCLVMTSGNVSGAAICRDDEDAVRELSRMCDVILSHNRLIRLRADDSVMDFHRGRPYMIRRSRGYAPLPFMMSMPAEGNVLAVGGELKNTFCVARNQLFYPSPYVGDTEDMRTVKALRESMKRMCDLLEAPPEVIACDRHPRYNSSAVARELAEELGLPLIEIQHHYAHIASCLAENDRAEKVIGVSFDGTGYGDDGTVWGGEFMTADLDGYERAGHISQFRQLGGDVSAKEGWRIAVAMLYGLLQDKGYTAAEAREKTAAAAETLGLCEKEELAFQFLMADRNINSVKSTSAGRLFDAVSAVLGIRRASTFEGEASTTLQFYAERWSEDPGKGSLVEAGEWIREGEDGAPELATVKLFERIADSMAEAVRNGMDEEQLMRMRERLAWEFHQGLADGIVQMCLEIRERTGLGTTALSGGVFQNRLLLRMCEDGLKAEGFEVLIHSMVPPNDGGIALGQAAVAARELKRMKEKDPAMKGSGPVIERTVEQVDGLHLQEGMKCV